MKTFASIHVNPKDKTFAKQILTDNRKNMSKEKDTKTKHISATQGVRLLFLTPLFGILGLASNTLALGTEVSNPSQQVTSSPTFIEQNVPHSPLEAPNISKIQVSSHLTSIQPTSLSKTVQTNHHIAALKAIAPPELSPKVSANKFLSPESSLDKSSTITVTRSHKAQDLQAQANNPEKSYLAQATIFPDIQGHWARSFVEVLAGKDIIRGFPDGTFRPDQAVTRAEYAAIVRKAFPKAAIRQESNFKDVPANFWGYTAVQEAYKTGFLEGYPNMIFKPNENIPRAQVLVSLTSGLNFSSTNTTNLGTYFQDADQIPSYASNAIAAATEKRLVVDYPNVNLLNPNQVASRADVAAFIYQALVSNGTLQPLAASDMATPYIVGYQPPTAVTPAPEKVTLEQLLLPEPPVGFNRDDSKNPEAAPGSSITSPVAFGAQWKDVFAEFSYQERTRYTQTDDGALSVGFGLGNPSKTVGLEVAIASVSTIRQGFFTNGTVSLKLHRLLTNTLSVAAGIENLGTWGGPDGGTSGYGVVSKYFQLKDSPDKPFSSVVTSIGFGGGRFRSESDVINRRDNLNVFGSVGVRVLRPVSVIADWSGQDLGLGVSIAPFRHIPITINPSVVDVTNNAGDGARFTIGVGYGLKF